MSSSAHTSGGCGGDSISDTLQSLSIPSDNFWYDELPSHCHALNAGTRTVTIYDVAGLPCFVAFIEFGVLVAMFCHLNRVW